MPTLSDYCEKIRMSKPEMLGELVKGSKEIERLDFCAYCLDGGKPSCEKFDMRTHLGLGSCSCCDYFFFGKNAVYLLEFTDLLKKKEDLQAEHKKKGHAFQHLQNLSEEDRDKAERQLFKDSVVSENLVKMYGTFFIFFWFARGCERMRKNVEKQEICKFKILFKVQEGQSRGDAVKSLENVSLALQHKVNQIRIAKKSEERPNAPSHGFAVKVKFIPYHDKETLERRLKEITVCDLTVRLSENRRKTNLAKMPEKIRR